jgi:hypothetical protein
MSSHTGQSKHVASSVVEGALETDFFTIISAMKTIFFLSFFFLNNLPAFAQKHDYFWVLGHNGGTDMNFNTSPVTISFADRNVEMSVTNASICDSLGNLLFYTNGCKIFNMQNVVMENGNNLNPGYIHDNYCVEPFSSYTAHRGALILPFPNDSDKYFLFHLGHTIVF